MTDEWIGKNSEGDGLGLTKVLYWHFPGETEENHEKLQSGYPLPQPRSQPNANLER
jgi:hypothetical protein